MWVAIGSRMLANIMEEKQTVSESKTEDVSIIKDKGKEGTKTAKTKPGTSSKKYQVPWYVATDH